MKYKCLVFDHDDTVVNSTATIHYPCFVEFNTLRHPALVRFTLEQFLQYNFDPGLTAFYRDICGLNEEEIREEQEYWLGYTRQHRATAIPGIREVMERHRAEGGIIAVVSHSFSENILRDFAVNGLPEPDAVFGFEQPREERKPSPVPARKILERFRLSPEDALVIDDLKPGYLMARAAGVDFAAAAWTYEIPANAQFMKANADYYCRTVAELEEII